MKIKSMIAAIMAALSLASCSSVECKDVKVDSYAVAYITSETQEYTHDCYLAKCGEIYVEVVWGLKWDSITIEKTSHVVYWHVYGVDEKVSNEGWQWKI